jgi:hypothetical protein
MRAGLTSILNGELYPWGDQTARNAITMASVMVDEIRLRAHARPLDEGEH